MRRMFSENQIEEMIKKGQKSPTFKLKEYGILEVVDNYKAKIPSFLKYAGKLCYLEIVNNSSEEVILASFLIPNTMSTTWGYNDVYTSLISFVFFSQEGTHYIELGSEEFNTTDEFVFNLFVLE